MDDPYVMFKIGDFSIHSNDTFEIIGSCEHILIRIQRADGTSDSVRIKSVNEADEKQRFYLFEGGQLPIPKRRGLVKKMLKNDTRQTTMADLLGVSTAVVQCDIRIIKKR